MKILITGATGLIGTQITKVLLEAGIEVNYLTTSKEKIAHSKGYQGYYWDPKNGEIDVAAFKDVTSIINLVGASIAERWTKSYKKVILESRTETANLIFKTLQQIDHEITHFISASGVSVYPSDTSKLYHEDDPKVAKTFLGEVVVAWEAAADQFKSIGIRVAKVRTGVVFASEDSAFVKIKEPIQKGFGAPLGSGEQWMSWIHLEDIANIYVHILKNGLEGVYNAVSPNPLTNKSLTFKIAAVLGKNIWLPNVPGFVLKLILGDMAKLLLESQLVSCKKIESTGFDFKFINPNYTIQQLV